MSDQTTQAEPRTLHFPPGTSTATLMFFPSREEVSARGDVEVPAGTFRTRLAVDSGDLEALSLLGVGDIQILNVRDMTLSLARALQPLGLWGLVLVGSCEPGVIAALAELDELEQLTLEDVVLDTESSDALAGLSRLRWLRLTGESSEAAAAAACRLTGLDHLSVMSSTSLGTGLDDVGALINLVQLILMVPDIGDGVAPRLHSLDKLQTLLLGTSGVRGAGMEVLAGLPQLDYLAIQSPEFDITTLELLKSTRSLTKLSLLGMAALDDRAAPLIARLSPPLEQVMATPSTDEAGGGAFSMSAQVWLARARPELSVNGFDVSEKAIAKYVAAGLGTHPITGGPELTP